MKRKFIKELEKWENENIKTPILVTGARQTGKTYIINEFCKKTYEKYVYLNFEKMPFLCEIFEKTLEPDEIIKNIENIINEEINPNNTAIFFDEIQISERAITSLKYFCESDINYRILCAGSLLGVKLHRFKSSFPVGKVRILNLYPLDFEEFLWAVDEEKLSNNIIECYKIKKPLLEILHQKAIKYYQDYLYIGGMPEAILSYINKDKDVIKFDKQIHNSIITSYIADMRKYTISASETIKINDIYESIPRQLAKENTKFKYNIVNKYAIKRDYELPLDWLIASSIVNKAEKIENIELPLKAYVDKSNFKIYLNDVGLLASMCLIEYKNLGINEENIFKGAITENFVAQSLRSKNIDLYYFKPNQNFEIDFIVNIEGNIIPIEVKAGIHKKSKSLNTYIEKYNPKYAIRLSLNNFGISDKIFSIPLYATFCI